MQQTGGMGRGQSLGHRATDRDHARRLEGVAVDDLLEGAPFDQLHHVPATVVGFHPAVDLNDRRMIHLGHRPRLPPQALDGDRRTLQIRHHVLERHRPPETLVEATIDLGHAAAPEPILDPIVADLLRHRTGGFRPRGSRLVALPQALDGLGLI